MANATHDTHHSDTHNVHDQVSHTVHGVDPHGAAAHGEHHEPHELPNWISILNEHFSDNPIVHFLHQWENVIFSSLAALVICFVAIRAANKKNLIPEGVQNFVEVIVEAIEGFASGILGPKYGPKYVPYLGTVFLYILLMNWSGLIPFMKSPTAAWSTTLAIALATMVYIQYVGISEQGLGHYLHHVAGSPGNVMGWVLVVIIFPLNIILEFIAVPFSLSLRLFANISSEDRLLLNFAQLGVNSPFFIGSIFQLFVNMLAIIFSIIQAFVFMLLSTVYISLVLPHDDHGHEEHGETEKTHGSTDPVSAH